MPDRSEIQSWFMSLQDNICASLEHLDGVGTFHQDKWERDGGGGGRTRIILGKHIEKGGVNFSAVSGKMPGKISKALGIDETDFFASGVSIVLHAKNPFVPIIHMNVRYFETTSGPWWFGGGIDVTPIYIIESQASFFHHHLKNVCDAHDPSYYAEFKNWADDYFFIKHRAETRGIGGIFFDRLSESRGSKQAHFNFVKDVGNAFVPIYTKLFSDNLHELFDQNHLDWQALRRSRYVEFNLVWDRGTKFGLDTNGRTESILMSMPPMAKWKYDYQPTVNSAEHNTQQMLKKGIDYLSLTE